MLFEANFSTELDPLRFLANVVRRLLPAQEQAQDSQNMIVSCAANFTSLKRRDPVDVCRDNSINNMFVRFGTEFNVTNQVDTSVPENAWLESPEFATFFSRGEIQYAKKHYKKLS